MTAKFAHSYWAPTKPISIYKTNPLEKSDHRVKVVIIPDNVASRHEFLGDLFC